MDEEPSKENKEREETPRKHAAATWTPRHVVRLFLLWPRMWEQGGEEYLHGNDFEIDVETCFATCFGSVAVIGTVTSIATVVASLLEMANVCHRILLETDFEKA